MTDNKYGGFDILLKRIPGETVNGYDAYALATFPANAAAPAGLAITFGDSFAIDAFGRLRTSDPEALLGGSVSISSQGLFWENYSGGTVTVSHLPNEAAIRFTVGTPAGSLGIRQSKLYCPYQPGKSQQVLVTFVWGEDEPGLIRRVGYFDDRNGIFLQQTSSGLAFVRRTFVSGVPVDVVYPQSSWNVDKMNGSGDSGININPAESQILFIDLEWLGVGRVRIGFVVNGVIFYAHEFLNTNNGLSTVYMSTGSLPVRYEIRTTAIISAPKSIDCICASVVSEGGQNIKAPIFAAGNRQSLRSVADTFLPITSIRCGTVFPGSGTVLNRSVVQPLGVSIFSEDAPVYFEVVLNPSLSGASFNPISLVHSGVEVDTSASSYSGGTVIDAGYVPATNSSKGSNYNEIETSITLGLNIQGTVGDILTVGMVRIGNVSSDCSATIHFKEIY